MGSFHLLPLSELCELLIRRGASGTLSCERGSVKKSMVLAQGVAVGAASNDPREYLGQLLINFGHIDEEQLAKAFETQQETKVKLGRVLTMVGLVRPEVIRETLALKIRETLLDVFQWDSGYFTLDEAEPPAPEELDAAVPLGEIAREAEFRSTAWSAFRASFPTGAATLVVNDEAAEGAGARGLDARLLALAREGKTIDEIGLALHAPDFHLYQRLYALHRQGVVTAGAPPSSDGMPAIALDASDLLRRAREALGARKTLEAEELAARAVDLAPATEGATELLKVARQALSAELRALLLVPPRIPVPRLPPHEIGRLRLSSAEKYLLVRCDGVRDVSHLVRVAPLTELEVLKAIRRFADARIVELKPLRG
ncbi:MAG: DUF4388 domain-containing protein [Deltaproteobacteria bacterium]|nr:DUF4388 domain-containing protein [Deltaproteobacteria bacterium]